MANKPTIESLQAEIKDLKERLAIANVKFTTVKYELNADLWQELQVLIDERVKEFKRL